MSQQSDALRDISTSLAGVDYQSSLGDCVYYGLRLVARSIAANDPSLAETVTGLTVAITKLADAMQSLADSRSDVDARP